MKRNRLLHISLPLVAAAALYSCVSDEPSAGNHLTGPGATFEATIDPVGQIPAGQTRALTAVGADKWSYLRFDSPTDTIGFFSAYGNLNAEGGNGPFTNEPMVWTRSVEGSTDSRWRGIFSGVNMNYDAGLIQTDNNKTFVYFPYAVGADTKGLRLRRKVASDNSERCVDALYIMHIADNNDVVMSGSFTHGFSELMITRGEGFDKPPVGSERITIVLNKGFSHVKVMDYPDNNHPDYWKVLMPVYDPDYESEGGLTEEQCRRWDAWRGEDYKPNELSDYKPAYYCILPTSLSNYRSVVDYIEICDNLGQWHKITSFYLYTSSNKQLQPGQRYDLNVVMEGLVPTIYPYGIHPWDDFTNVTDERGSGVNDPSQFFEFISTYNSYIRSDGSRDPQYEEALKKYGDKYVTDGVTGWHFYINNSFDISTVQGPGQNFNYKINNLCDTIDGLRNTLSNIRITDDSGFIGQLSEGGCVKNLDVAGLNVTNSYASDQVTGGLVNIMTGGTITSCNIDGNINSPGLVGMAVGQMTGGTITGCSFSGLLVGGGTYLNLFGKEPTVSSTWQTGNNSSGLIFTSY